GIAGVDGNGQSELIDALTGLRHPASGSVSVGGHDLSHATARQALDAGMGHIPEDRHRRGLVLDFNLAENLVLHDYGKEPFSRFGWVNPRRWFRWARGLLQEFDVRGGGPTTRGGSLSGGNQQKVVVAREVSRDPQVLIAAQPTRGLDVGAIEFVHRRLVEQRDAGIVTPFLTAVFAFLMGGIGVGATGHNPLRVYKAIFEGAGLNWFYHFGSYHVDIPFTNHHIWFWWDTSSNHTAEYNLTQTLLTTTPLILTGLAVAFAFRCGLFNIGGQGQYLMGAIVGVDVGARFVSRAPVPHVLLAVVLASLAGAFWGAIAGFLKATVGAH